MALISTTIETQRNLIASLRSENATLRAILSQMVTGVSLVRQIGAAALAVSDG